MLQIFTVTHTHTLAKWEDVNSLRVTADLAAKLIVHQKHKKRWMCFFQSISNHLNWNNIKKCQITISVYISPISGKLPAMQCVIPVSDELKLIFSS